MEQLFTIGVYGFEAEHFFSTLEQAGVDLVLDLRRRRGVRGQQYSFANARRLQAELKDRGIAYRHLIELAPQPETRKLQDREDLARRVAKRRRESLADAFVADYTTRTLERFSWDALIEELMTVRRPVLLCVERLPAACHRHLVAEQLAHRTGTSVSDLLP